MKWLKSGALVHDASYCHPIQLEGPEDSILAILRMVLLPSPSGTANVSEEVSRAVLHGVCYENAMLYHVGTPLSKFIAPVIYMWRPSLRDDDYINAEKDPLPNGCSISGKNECSTSYRQLWIWIHAAGFKEGSDALRFACQKQMHESRVSVSCFSLEGHITKLEVMGSKAIPILQKILHPVSGSCSTSEHFVACTNSKVQKFLFLDHADKLPLNAILSLTVHDPRDLPSWGTELAAKAPSAGSEIDMQKEDVQDSDAFLKNKDILFSLWSKPETHGIFLSDSKNLWDSSDKLNPPTPDNVLCTEKHHRRLQFFYLDHANDETPATEAKYGFGRSCSVLLLKHPNQRNLGTRWSIILPLSWVKAFWISLVSLGAHAVGLRERRWIACDNGLPSFPFDFPDCKAYSLFMAAEATAFDRAAECRPLSVRPLRVPIPPPWDCLMSSVEKGPYIIGGRQTPDEQHLGGEVAAVISLVNPEDLESPSSSEQAGASFQGFVIRTSKGLDKYLEKIYDLQLLLFPNMAMVDKGFPEMIDNNRPGSVVRNVNSMLTDKELCFVRVLLHAYKEGVFEEGAIVCAPILTDHSHWTSRSEDHGKLQIPHSFIRSYFTQQDSGKWELQVPEDCLTLQSYRWPIGFVTTGFVRGSAKPVAEALCEARLLSLLRRQQWKQTQTLRPEIFVLVRNLRSAAYRHAFATIVLEQQKEDLEFM